MSSDECIFCSLLWGEGEAVWIARRQRASALLPLESDQLAPGHTLVIPNEHAVGIQDASPQSVEAVALLAQEIAQAMSGVIGARGVNILNASGPGSDQSVPHFHLHVVPRWHADGLDTWPSTSSVHTLQGGWTAALQHALTTS
ncbi:HIT family protein [Acidipropionibacterium thoenii]|uniref:HIT family protein n=1 Tax=Acidipropionibacterium thoenii TaxID=1751 RepID=UPI0003F84C90|nr:HIT domain-containing protein [Acidipropionibacterium thoenii]